MFMISKSQDNKVYIYMHISILIGAFANVKIKKKSKRIVNLIFLFFYFQTNVRETCKTDKIALAYGINLRLYTFYISLSIFSRYDCENKKRLLYNFKINHIPIENNICDFSAI